MSRVDLRVFALVAVLNIEAFISKRQRKVLPGDNFKNGPLSGSCASRSGLLGNLTPVKPLFKRTGVRIRENKGGQVGGEGHPGRHV